MLIAVNYHYIRASFDARNPSIFGVTPAEFERQLNILGNAATFVSAQQVRNAVRGIETLPERSLLITFDDGLKEQYELAWPILRNLGIPAIFFINTAPIVDGTVLTVHKIHLLRAQLASADLLAVLKPLAAESGINLALAMDRDKVADQYPYDDEEAGRVKYLLNFELSWAEREQLVEVSFNTVFPGQEAHISRDLYMNVSQVQELSRFAGIGNHSHQHFPLGLLPRETIDKELCRTNALLKTWTGASPFALSYPYGSQAACSLEAGALAMERGMDFAFTMERAVNLDFSRPLHLARFDSNDVTGGKACQMAVPELFDRVPAARWFREERRGVRRPYVENISQWPVNRVERRHRFETSEMIRRSA